MGQLAFNFYGFKDKHNMFRDQNTVLKQLNSEKLKCINNLSYLYFPNKKNKKKISDF